jgi:hypothetical protein
MMLMEDASLSEREPEIYVAMVQNEGQWPNYALGPLSFRHRDPKKLMKIGEIVPDTVVCLNGLTPNRLHEKTSWIRNPAGGWIAVTAQSAAYLMAFHVNLEELKEHLVAMSDLD